MSQDRCLPDPAEHQAETVAALSQHPLAPCAGHAPLGWPGPQSLSPFHR